jgi:hypothetical protein
MIDSHEEGVISHEMANWNGDGGGVGNADDRQIVALLPVVCLPALPIATC